MNKTPNVMETIDRYKIILDQQGEEAALDYYLACAELMDADIHAEISKSLEGICSTTEEDFLETYCLRHERKFGEKFRCDPHQMSALGFKGKEKRNMQTEHMRTVTDEALEAFWQVVARRYPQAESGDLSPLATVRLQEAAQVAIDEWIQSNVPTTTNG